MANVAEQVKAMIAEKLGVSVDEVVDSANISSDLGADSLDIVELVMDFESAFGIEISDDDAGDKISTVGDAVKYIENRLNEK
jgi:acyl carrier protein